jgi:hypothetical protein
VRVQRILKMPRRVYLGLLGRCPLASREYAVLRNSLVKPEPAAGNVIMETLCRTSDTELLLERAKQFYSDAIPFIEEALASVMGIADLTVSFSRTPRGETWHFCANCSQWPTQPDCIISTRAPDDYAMCNECLVRHRTGECS